LAQNFWILNSKPYNLLRTMAMNKADVPQVPEECTSGEVALYNKESRVGAIASSKGFRIFGLMMTVLFLSWQGIDADYNAANVLVESEPVFQAMHMIFLLFFGIEALVRFSALCKKRQILKCRTLTWDIILVAFLIVQASVTSISSLSTHRILRVVGLLQFTRVVRLRQSHKKLNEGSLVAEAARELLRCFVQIVFLHYMFAINMVKATQGIEVGEKYFPNVAQGMKSLPDVSGVMKALLAESRPGAFIMYLMFLLRCILVLILTVKNVLVQIRTSRTAQTQSTCSAADKNEESADKV